MSAISPLSLYNDYAGSSSSNTVQQNDDGLSMDDFYTLLAAELQYQDPLGSSDGSSGGGGSTDYMTQMAQFSTLEQMRSLTTSMNYLFAGDAVGKSVLYDYQDAQGNTQMASGTIEAVDLSTGTPECYINGGWVALSSVTTIYDSSAGSGSDGSGSDGSGSDGSGSDGSDGSGQSV